MTFNKQKPYSSYKYHTNYARTVGQFCSLLWHNKICSSEDIDKILSTSELFKNIEENYNPMLMTSGEMVWFSILFRDKI